MAAPTDPDRLRRTLERFDELNAADPNEETDAAGQVWPKELLYGRRMSERLAAFAPDASEAVRLAARAQHIERFKRPRSDYPMDRKGYRRWRQDAGAFHARRAGEVMAEQGYDETMVERVRSLLRKEGIKRNPEMQLLEDVICLVFLQHYWAPFSEEYDDEKLIKILQRTWKKMSPAGHAAALELELSGRPAELVEAALAE